MHCNRRPLWRLLHRRKKAPAKKAAATAQGDAFETAGAFAENAQEYFSEFVTKMSDAAEDMREQAEDIAEDLRTRFETQQKLATDVNAEIVEATKSEVSDAVQFASDLGKAKTFADALEIQQAYWTKLFETRVQRSQELTEKSVAAAKEAFTPLKGEFPTLFDASAFEKIFQFPAKA